MTNTERIQTAESRGWVYDLVEGNGVDGYLWISPEGLAYSYLPAFAYSPEIDYQI